MHTYLFGWTLRAVGGSYHHTSPATRYQQGSQIRPASAVATPPQPTTMKVAFLSLLALVSAALAVPPYSAQSVFDVSEQDVQGIREGVNFVFDKAEDKVKQWIQDGRDFINHNGLTCQSGPRAPITHGISTIDCDQMNLLPTLRFPRTGFV